MYAKACLGVIDSKLMNIESNCLPWINVKNSYGFIGNTAANFADSYLFGSKFSWLIVNMNESDI